MARKDFDYYESSNEEFVVISDDNLFHYSFTIGLRSKGLYQMIQSEEIKSKTYNKSKIVCKKINKNLTEVKGIILTAAPRDFIIKNLKPKIYGNRKKTKF